VRITLASEDGSLRAPMTGGRPARTLPTSSTEGGIVEASGFAQVSSFSRTLVAGLALLGVALAAGLAAWGTFGDDNHETGDYLVVLAVIGVAALVIFAWIVPRALRKESAGATALVLAVLAVLTIGVFWSGLPPLLAAGAIALGSAGWNARSGATLCRAAVVIALFAVVGDVAIYIGDMA
jgi:hypothetical protein